MSQSLAPGWELIVYRLPTSPSGPRVAVWRELRRLGALPLQQSVVAVPVGAPFSARLDAVTERIEREHGSVYRFRLTQLPAPQHERLVAEWNGLRNQEYTEIVTECETRFSREIEFELFRGGFTNSDAERLEADLEKVRAWFARITERDVHGAELRGDAEAAIQRSQAQLDEFVVHVYEVEMSQGALVLRPPDDADGADAHDDARATAEGTPAPLAAGASAFTRLMEAAEQRRISRRSVLRRATALGLTAPAIAILLAACGGDDDEPVGTATTTTAATSVPPTMLDATAETVPAASSATAAPSATTAEESPSGRERGAGEQLRILYWQAPTILNPHLAQGGKDFAAASLVLEPLLDVDPAGNLVPVLAAAVPSVENGGIASDGLSVTYTLKEGVLWSDGEPFTAADVRFTWQYATDPAAAVTSAATYAPIEDVEVVDDLTLIVRFAEPTPGWFGPFCTGYGGQILPEHLLRDAVGEQAMDAPFNLLPIGTGPYKVTEFRPGDVVLYDINEHYREPDKPYFSDVEFKGGGDAASAARAALQTDETDWAWNLQVEKAVLEEIAAAGDGVLVPFAPINVEQMLINHADPRAEGDLRSEPSTTHPFLSDRLVRQAFALGVDRQTIADELYGATGTATANVLVAPERFVSRNTSMVYELAEANQLLDQAGWVRDGDVRRKDDLTLSVVCRASINSVRQKTQEIIKEAWAQLGIQTEIEAIDAGVFFSSDPGNPDTFSKFYADFQMLLNGPSVPFPIGYMDYWKSTDPDLDLSQRSNDWTGLNYGRWVNAAFNELYTQARVEIDEARQAELFVAMNDLIFTEVATVAIVARSIVAGVNARLKGYSASPWTPDVRDIADWYWEE